MTCFDLLNLTCFTLGSLSLPVRQQPHASRAEDVEGGLLVLDPGYMGCGEVEQRLEIDVGFLRCLGQGGDTCRQQHTWVVKNLAW